MKDSAETFELFCSIKCIPYTKIVVLRWMHVDWQLPAFRRVILPTGQEAELQLEIIRVKDYGGRIHDVGYYVKQDGDNYYVSLPIFREHNETSER